MTALWDKLKKGKDKQEPKDGAGKDIVKKSEKKKAKKNLADKERSGLFNRILIKPLISENAMNHQALGKYIFKVSQRANKPEVAKAAQALYGVEVEKVNIINEKPKNSNFRMKAGRKSGTKKAIISLKKGQSIELFKEAK